MTRSSRELVLLAALLLTAVTPIAAAADAANLQGPHMTQGYVVGVRHGNGQGTFSIRMGPRNVNAGGANRMGANGAAGSMQFTVGPATQFEAVNGVMRMPTSFAALRPGQRIQVQAQGQQAVGVRIFAHNRSNGSVRRMRPVGTGHISRVARVNQTTQGLSATGHTARVKQPRASSSQRNAFRSAKAHTVAHVSATKL